MRARLPLLEKATGRVARVIEILLCIAILLFWLPWGCWLVQGQQGNIPPDILMVNELRCEIAPAGKQWAATGIAKYGNHDKYQHDPWTAKFPPRKSIEASAKDCDHWFTAVNKIQALTRPVDVNQLKKEKQ